MPSDVLRKGADKALEHAVSGWWERRSSTERTATALIAFGLAIGPLGQGLFAALGALYRNSIPSTRQLEAVWWLLVTTAPLAGGVFTAALRFGRHHPMHVLVPAALAALLAGFVAASSPAATELAGFYCYADFDGTAPVYESACREFDHRGFVAENRPYAGSPSGSARILASAVAYTVDARGTLMVVASVSVSVGLGLLLRGRP